MTEATFRAFYRAWLLGDKEKADALQEQLPDGEYRSSDDLVSATFCVVVEQQFKNDSSPAAVRTFMDEARQNFAKAQPAFKPLIAEALIRGVLGEQHLIDEVDANDFTPTQMPITRKIIAESTELQARIDDILDDAEKLTAYWASQPD